MHFLTPALSTVGTSQLLAVTPTECPNSPLGSQRSLLSEKGPLPPSSLGDTGVR